MVAKQPYHITPDVTFYVGDALDVLKGLPSESVHCCVTSPPYWGLRDYGVDGQLGLESTPEEYVEHMVEVFRAVHRALRDDGTVWLNLGDSYSSGTRNYRDPGKSVMNGGERVHGLTEKGTRPIAPNLLNCLESSIKGSTLFLAGRHSLTITTKGLNVTGDNHRTPDSEFTSLFGVKRIFVKQGDNHFCQILNLLNTECCVRISPAVRLVAVENTYAEIILDAGENGGIVISDDDLNTKTPLLIAIRALAAENGQAALTVKEPTEPITEGIGNGEPAGNPVAFNTPCKGFLQVDLVDDLVSAGECFAARADGLSDFNVTEASRQHFALSMLQGSLDLTIRCVTHLFASNKHGSLIRYAQLYDQAQRKANTLVSKQELGIPDMVKRALMEDGWICRCTIIWYKTNPIPESVTDRPTKAHEYIFLLSKSSRYFYDAEAIKEPSIHAGKTVVLGEKSLSRGQARGANVEPHGNGTAQCVLVTANRNKRSVWTVATAPFSESHFATFPPDLIKPCILAGTSERGCCPECGKPWERVLERSKQLHGSRPQARRAMEIAKANSLTDQHIAAIQSAGITDAGKAMITQTGTGKNTAEVQALAQEAKDVLGGYYREYLSAPQETVGWQPSCKHGHEPIPCTVLDCFGGAGTTALVSRQLNRKSVYIDLNTEYADMAIRRLEGQSLPLPLEVG